MPLTPECNGVRGAACTLMNISCFIPLLFTGVCRRRPLVTFPFSCKVAGTQEGRVSDSLFVERHHGDAAEGGGGVEGTTKQQAQHDCTT